MSKLIGVCSSILTLNQTPVKYRCLVLKSNRITPPDLERQDLNLSESCHGSDLLQAQNRYEEGRLLDLLDKKLNTGQAPPPQDVQRVLTIALMCIQMNAARRPSMSTVLAMLLGEQELGFVTQESSIDNINRTLLALQSPDHQEASSRRLEPTREAEEPLLREIEAPRMSQCSNTLELSDVQPR